MGGAQSQVLSSSNEGVAVEIRDGWGIVDSGNPGDDPQSKQSIGTYGQITENQKDQSSDYEDVADDLADDNELAEASQVDMKESAEALCQWRGPLTHEEMMHIMATNDYDTLNSYIDGRTGAVINQFTPPWIVSGRTKKTKNEADTEKLLLQAKEEKDKALEHLYSDISIFQGQNLLGDPHDLRDVWRRWIHDKAAWESAKQAEIMLNKQLSLGIVEKDKRTKD